MKLVCGREELSRALQAVLRTVGTRAGIPAVSGVLLEVSAEGVVLTTTDLELTTRVRLEVGGEEGRVLLPARVLGEVVRNLASSDVEMVQEDGTVRVVGGRARFALRLQPAEDFPRLQPSGEVKELVLEGAALRRALGQVVVAASRDETRPVLCGVLFEGLPGELRLVATDSYRLALRSLPATGAEGLKVLVPSRACSEVTRLVGSEEIRLTAGATQVSFDGGEVSLQSRVIEGEFPAYQQILPASLPFRLEVVREAFLESLRRVAVLAQDASPLFVELEEGSVRLSCQSHGLGEGSEEIDGSYAGEAMRVAFNPSYLQAGVEAVEDERVAVELSDPQRPVLVRGVGRQDFVYLLMPIRVS